jgi:ammonium transporter, Amt family
MEQVMILKKLTSNSAARSVSALPPFFLTLLIGSAAFASETKIDSGDTAWMLTSATLVLLMTIPGLALFYAGLARKKNALATAIQSFATTCLVAVIWTVVGYSLTFSDGNGFGAFIGDFNHLFLRGMDVNKAFVLGAGTPAASAMTFPEPVFMMYEMTFAIITPALIAGAFAERMKFSAMLLFMGLWSLLVYAPIAHWVWHPGGFLAKDGILDYAGGTVVHINAGVAGLVCALVLGKRIGYPEEQNKPYNPLKSMIGASLLWVGWFGFNGGSAFAANGRAGMAIAVTMIAAALAGLAWMFTEWKLKGKPSMSGILCGSVAGLVAVTPASGYIEPSGALWIGGIAGVACYLASTALKEKLNYDDSLDCFGVHGIGGFIGALLTGVFATSAVTGTDVRGWIDGNPGQVLIQLKGVVATIAWSGIMTLVILQVVKVLVGLRVTHAEELQGLDLSLHGEALVRSWDMSQNVVGMPHAATFGLVSDTRAAENSKTSTPPTP